MHLITYSKAELRGLMIDDAGIEERDIKSEEWATDGSLTLSVYESGDLKGQQAQD